MGKGIAVSSANDHSLCLYFLIILIPHSLTGLAVTAGEECRAMAETTPSFPADLVLNDAAASREP